jgi:hypothetical protein
MPKRRLSRRPTGWIIRHLFGAKGKKKGCPAIYSPDSPYFVSAFLPRVALSA